MNTQDNNVDVEVAPSLNKAIDSIEAIQGTAGVLKEPADAPKPQVVDQVSDFKDDAEPRQQFVNSLSPFKKQIGLLLIGGMPPEEVAIKLSSEQNKNLPTI